MKLKNTQILLLLIIIVSALLRTYNITSIPFTHDEFSALFRTDFSDFNELIEHGVKSDVHPAGIQVFLYYYVKIFGTAEWIIKLPFIIAGIFSVLLIFLIGKKWYNDTVGLVAASFLASIQFAVIYSQIVRPYMSGLLFALLMVYFLTNIVLNPQRRLYLNLLFFIISASLCAYNHYFSLLFAGIVGITGLFLVQKKYLIKYILSGLIIALLYLPHLQIFTHQLSKGGVETWLGKPQNDFIINYLQYIFQFSVFSWILIAVIFLLGFYKIKNTCFSPKFFAVSLIWFILPFLIGFFYSMHVNSVLQYSVLIFSFPFILFVLFGHLPRQNRLINTFLVIIILGTNSLILILERKHYDLFYKSPYEQIFIEHKNKSDDNVISVINTHQKIDPNEKNIIYKKDQCTHYNITEYYIEKHSIDYNSFIDYNLFKNESEFVKFMEQNHEKYESLYFGCLSWNNPLIIPVILDYFPNISWQKNYVAGTSYLFSKKESNIETVSVLDFETDKENWTPINKENLTDTLKFSGNYSYYQFTEWSITYVNNLADIITSKNNFIDISVKVYPLNGIENILLVSSLEKPEGDVIDWRAISFDTFFEQNTSYGQWRSVHHSIKLSDIYLGYNYNDVILKVYIWNKEQKGFLIDDFSIKLRQGNPIIYGHYEKI